MTSIISSFILDRTIELASSYKIILILTWLAFVLILAQPWVSLPLALFGLFLLFQSVNTLLQFTQIALDIYRSSQLSRCFSHAEWKDWRFLGSPIPILFSGS